mmetsp:Transcript_37001/g.87925  ORF Transcript_37001/g.87925 Transcript_37001/m.87925 type:complete len:244 (+) Transcript_37001:1159-1890(+)
MQRFDRRPWRCWPDRADRALREAAAVRRLQEGHDKHLPRLHLPPRGQPAAVPHRRQPLHTARSLLHTLRGAPGAPQRRGRDHGGQHVGPSHHRHEGHARPCPGQPARAGHGDGAALDLRQHADQPVVADAAAEAAAVCDPLQRGEGPPRRRRRHRPRDAVDGQHRRPRQPLPPARGVRRRPQEEGRGGRGPSIRGQIGCARGAAEAGPSGRHPGALQGMARGIRKHAANLRPRPPRARGELTT